MSRLAARLRCTRGQLVTAALGLLLAVPTFVATVAGLHDGPPQSSTTTGETP